MRWVWDMEPRDPFKLLAPLLGRIMGRRLDTMLTNIKRLLEAEEMPLPGTLYTVSSTTSTDESGGI